MNCLRTLVVIAIASISIASVDAGTIFVDLDPATMGIQTTATVTSGTTITAQIIYDPTVGPPPVTFTGFGVDLNWMLGGTAGSTTPPSLLAGDFPGLVPVPVDAFSGIPVVPGDPLANPGVASPFVGAANIGGGGIEDLAAVVSMPLAPVNLAGAEFTVTGAPGDTVTFIASGIIVAPIGLGPPTAPGSSPFQNFLVTTLVDVPFHDGSVLTIAAVPEPASFAALALAGGVLVVRRRKR